MPPQAQRLLDEIQQEIAFTAPFTGVEQLSPRLLDALRTVPRERFVPKALRSQAWANHPLPIGQGQTISQPFIVALMTQLLDPTATSRILEIGTGSGYQSAVLARLAGEVYSMERLPELQESAREQLTALGIHNVHLIPGDGYAGLPEFAPYDGILVTAAAASLPNALPEQLAPGGRLVIPLGPPHGEQQIHRLIRDAQGRIHDQPLLPVAFVPLVPDRG